MCEWDLWNLGFQFQPVFGIVGAEYIINNISLRNKICTTNKEMFDVVLLHQLPGLDFSQSAEHFSKLIQRYKVWVTGKVVLIEFSVFHIAISLSKNLVIEDADCYNDFVF